MAIDWASIITATVSAISGGGLVGIINAKENKRKQKLENDHSAADAWRELYERSDKESDELKNEVKELRAEVAKLQEQLSSEKAQKTKFELQKCEVLGCEKRKPPRDF